MMAIDDVPSSLNPKQFKNFSLFLVWAVPNLFVNLQNNGVLLVKILMPCRYKRDVLFLVISVKKQFHKFILSFSDFIILPGFVSFGADQVVS